MDDSSFLMDARSLEMAEPSALTCSVVDIPTWMSPEQSDNWLKQFFSENNSDANI